MAADPESEGEPAGSRYVVITDVRLSFGTVFWLVVKFTLASALLAIILGFVYIVLIAVVGRL